MSNKICAAGAGKLYPAWTAEQESRLCELAGQGLSWAAIGAALDRTADACHRRYYQLRGPCSGSRAHYAPSLVSSRARQLAAATAAQARLKADEAERSLTAILCGDPLPGRSALDQRRPPQRRITLPGMMR